MHFPAAAVSFYQIRPARLWRRNVTSHKFQATPSIIGP
jgi:hypothetical protein